MRFAAIGALPAIAAVIAEVASRAARARPRAATSPAPLLQDEAVNAARVAAASPILPVRVRLDAPSGRPVAPLGRREVQAVPTLLAAKLARVPVLVRATVTGGPSATAPITRPRVLAERCGALAPTMAPSAPNAHAIMRAGVPVGAPAVITLEALRSFRRIDRDKEGEPGEANQNEAPLPAKERRGRFGDSTAKRFAQAYHRHNG